MSALNETVDIYMRYSDTDTLRALAEECSELSAAALKLVRALEGKTPKPKDICMMNFLEEFADVECVMMVIMNADWFDPEAVDKIYSAKIERWRKRLERFDRTWTMMEGE